MASLKDVKAKIGGVKKTRQITKAMNMVAASRLRGTQLTMEAFRPYAEKFSQVLSSVASRAGEEVDSPLLRPRDEVKKIHVVMCTSDRGLCGGFNVNLFEATDKFIKDAGDSECVITNFGKRGRDWAKSKKLTRLAEHIGVMGTVIKFSTASGAGAQFIEGFMEGQYDEVHIVYSRFDSMARQTPVVQQLLPIPPIEAEEGGADGESEGYMAEHICEPSVEGLLNELLPRQVFTQIYQALLETSTSEHAARMTAMDNATKACNDMLDELTLAYNKARQAAITTELMDIVGGAEALKG